MTCRPCGLPCFRRSNRHLHHRPDNARASSVVGHAGEQATSAPVTTTQPRFFTEAMLRRAACIPFARAASRCVCQRRDSNPLFPCARSIRYLHHQRRFSRMTRQTGLKQISFAAPGKAPLLRTPRGSLCHRYPAYASFPPTGPALLGTHLSGASPGIRVSRSGLRRDIFQ